MNPPQNPVLPVGTGGILCPPFFDRYF